MSLGLGVQDERLVLRTEWRPKICHRGGLVDAISHQSYMEGGESLLALPSNCLVYCCDMGLGRQQCMELVNLTN